MNRAEIASLIRKLESKPSALHTHAALVLSDVLETLPPQEEFVVDLTRNVAKRGSKTVYLSPSEAVVAYTIANNTARYVTLEEVKKALYGKLKHGSDNAVRSFIHTARVKLQTIGVDLPNYFRKGYSLELD